MTYLYLLSAAGLTAAVLQAIDAALAHHELIKVKLHSGDRWQRRTLAADICSHTGSECVQHIGRIAVLYRRARQPAIRLPGMDPVAEGNGASQR